MPLPPSLCCSSNLSCLTLFIDRSSNGPRGRRTQSGGNNTSVRYTTQEILPAFAWIDSGVKSSDLEPRQLIARNVAGNDVLIGKDEKGALFCVSNLCPHIGTAPRGDDGQICEA